MWALQELISKHGAFDGDNKISLVPDRHGTGTNCLLSTPVTAVPMCFGSNSRQAFAAAAAELDVACQELALPALQFDVDDPADIRDLLLAADAESRRGSRSIELLREFDLDLDAPAGNAG
jgi:2-phospho-L-lactate guanylyltransferase